MNRQNLHIDFLDQIRGIAILGVFLFHALCFFPGGGQLPWGTWMRDFPETRSFLLFLPLSLGWAGVPIFFVISGFCIHLSFARSRQRSLLVFYLRRFFRIYPPYLIALIGSAIVVPMIAFNFNDPATIASFLSHLSLVQNFHPQAISINPSFWTIAIEVQLYLIYPVLLFFVAKLGWRRTLFALAVLEIGFNLFPRLIELYGMQSPIPAWMLRTPLTFWYSWSIGVWQADAFLQNQPLPFLRSRLSIWWGLALVTYWIKPLADLSFLCFAVLAAVYLAKLLSGKMKLVMPERCLTSLRWLGVSSYSIYLLHQPLMHWFVQGCINASPEQKLLPVVKFLLAVLSGILIFPLSASFYHYCELPSITLGKRIISKVQLAR